MKRDICARGEQWLLAVIVLLDFPVERYKQSIEIRGLSDIVKYDISSGGFRVWREREREE